MIIYPIGGTYYAIQARTPASKGGYIGRGRTRMEAIGKVLALIEKYRGTVALPVSFEDSSYAIEIKKT